VVEIVIYSIVLTYALPVYPPPFTPRALAAGTPAMFQNLSVVVPFGRVI